MKILSLALVLFAFHCQADVVTASPTAGPAATKSTVPSVDQKVTPLPSPSASPSLKKKKSIEKKKQS